MTDRDLLLTDYHRVHGQYVEGAVAERRAWFLEHVRANLVEHLPGPGTDPAILELGCGRGHLLAALRELGYSRLEGVDTSAEDVRLAREEEGLERVHVGEAGAFLRSRQGEYDVVLAKAFLEHVPRNDIFPLLGAVRDALRPGGRALFEVPNMDWLFAAHERYMDFTHEVGFTRESLAQVLRAVFGESVRVVPVGPDLRPWWHFRLVRRLVWPPVRGLIRFVMALMGDQAEETWWEYRGILGVAETGNGEPGTS